MENLDIKKIIIFLAVIGLSGFLILLFFFGQKTGEAPGGGDFEAFFPFGEEPETGLGKDRQTIDYDRDILDDSQRATGEILPLLRQITPEPVAGAILFRAEKMGEDEYAIRYLEKATGHIYETTTKTVALKRLSNTTIPQVRDALWLDETSLLVRYLDDDIIKTFSAQLIQDDAGEQKLEGEFLRDDIKEIIKFGGKIFYLIDGGEGSLGIISDPNGENKKQLFTSPLREWLIAPVDKQRVSFTTKPAAGVRGYSFLFNTKTNSFDKVLDNKLNLSTLTNSVLDILYFQNGSLGPKLYIYDNQKKINRRLPLSAFPEKCLWSADNVHIYCGLPSGDLSNKDLDRWYKGQTSFSDDIWKIDTETDALELLISPAEFSSAQIDAIKMSSDENEEYLLFINKKDFSLWSLRLKKDL
ncbi:MAG: hypothetical protein KAV41_01710 [Candidatus Pacebacteria bacterium]|nr:hypothetical protein [Candidatus Paceibacterota bacterium]